MGYLSIVGISLPPNAFIVSAGFLLPINSAMNPLLYSRTIGRLASTIKAKLMKKLSISGVSLDLLPKRRKQSVKREVTQVIEEGPTV